MPLPFAGEPKASIVTAYREAGGEGPKYAEVPMAWAPDDSAIKAGARDVPLGRDRLKVMSELPNPVNFDAASATVRAEDVVQQFAVGPDPEKYVQQYVDAGRRSCSPDVR